MSNTSFIHRFAENKKITTFLAIFFEVQMLIACFLLGDAIVQNVLQIQTMFSNSVPLTFSFAYIIVLQYIIIGLELIVRFRGTTKYIKKGKERKIGTCPIVFLPCGIIFRTLFMAVLEILILIFKLLIYFLSVLFEFLCQIFGVSKYIGSATLVDVADSIMEPLEYGINSVYNFLYFHKIQPNTSVFSSVFNGSLSLWCINH